MGFINIRGKDIRAVRSVVVAGPVVVLEIAALKKNQYMAIAAKFRNANVHRKAFDAP